MSHLSRIRTRFRFRDALIQCLTEMGYEVTEDTVIQGHDGQHRVDSAAKKRGGYGIGFVKGADGTYDMIADWWGISGKGEQAVADVLQRQSEKIQQEYAKKIVIGQSARDGFSIVSETVEEDGSVRIVVRRWN